MALKSRKLSGLDAGKDAGKTGDAEGKPLKLDGLSDSLGYCLRRAQVSVFQQYSEFMREFDVRPSQYSLLTLLDNNPGSKPTVVSHTLGVQKANFVGLLDSVERRGLTERRKEGPDRRAYALYLTPQGKVFVKKMRKHHQKLENLLTQTLGKEQTVKLLELLHTLQDRKLSGGNL